MRVRRARRDRAGAALLGLGLAGALLTVLTVLGVVGLGGPADGAADDAAAAAPTAPPAPIAATLPAPTAPLVVTPAQRARCAADEVACVDTVDRVAWLQRDGAVVYGPVPMLPGANTGLVPAGEGSAATPYGAFHVLRKDADHTSSEFDEPMPHAIFFAPNGIAFHEGSLVTPSHGCVHLTAADATAFFAALRIGDGVRVF